MFCELLSCSALVALLYFLVFGADSTYEHLNKHTSTSSVAENLNKRTLEQLNGEAN
jgi:hypothetical protein